MDLKQKDETSEVKAFADRGLLLWLGLIASLGIVLAASLSPAAWASDEPPPPTPSTPMIFFPAVVGAAWQPLEVDSEGMPVSTVLRNARGIGVCPSNSALRYVGTLEGTFRWSPNDAEWVPEPDDGPLNVRDFLFADGSQEGSCAKVVAAALDQGVWQKSDGEWQLLGNEGDISGIRTLAARDGILFAGTARGLRHTDDVSIPAAVEWQETGLPGLISHLELVGERLFAAIWTVGESHNDKNDDLETWSAATAPDGDTLAVKVLGYPGDPAEPWLLATTSGIYRWQANGEWVVTNVRDKLVYTLLSYSYETRCQTYNLAFAGLSDGGVLVTYDEGRSWQPLGNLVGEDGKALTVFDMAVADDGLLFAATPNSGVWIWQLPQSTCTPTSTPTAVSSATPPLTQTPTITPSTTPTSTVSPSPTPTQTSTPEPDEEG